MQFLQVTLFAFTLQSFVMSKNEDTVALYYIVATTVITFKLGHLLNFFSPKVVVINLPKSLILGL